jgi:hypothetical protein
VVANTRSTVLNKVKNQYKGFVTCTPMEDCEQQKSGVDCGVCAINSVGNKLDGARVHLTRATLQAKLRQDFLGNPFHVVCSIVRVNSDQDHQYWVDGRYRCKVRPRTTHQR